MIQKFSLSRLIAMFVIVKYFICILLKLFFVKVILFQCVSLWWNLFEKMGCYLKYGDQSPIFLVLDVSD